MTQETAYFGETLKSGAGMLAAADLSAAQFKAVTIGSSGVSLVASQGAAQVKVLTNKPTSGRPCALVDIGETKAWAGAAVAKGAVVMTDSSGRFVTYVNNGTNCPVGEARMAAGAAGDIFTIFLWPTPAVQGSAEGAISDTITAFAGGGRTSAVALVNGWNRISVCATNGDSVVLPAAAAGMMVTVINDGAANAQVFGNGSDTVDAVAGATGVVLTAAKRAIYFCLTAAKWQSLMGVKSA